MKELLTLWPGLQFVQGSPRHPQSQGLVEQGNATAESVCFYCHLGVMWVSCVSHPFLTLSRDLASMMSNQKRSDWTAGLKDIQYSMNTTIPNGFKHSPYFFLFGYSPCLQLILAKAFWRRTTFVTSWKVGRPAPLARHHSCTTTPPPAPPSKR